MELSRAMSCSYQEVIAENQTVDSLSCPRLNLEIEVARKGAELISFRKNGRGFLYRDGDIRPPAKGWGNHSTVMGYFLHRLKNERSVYLGREVRGGNHSFLRNKRFSAPDISLEDCRLTYHVSPGEYAPDEYPFRVGMTLSYQLAETGLKVEFRFKNEEAHDCHVSFGLHPGFACGSLNDFEIDLPPGIYTRQSAPNNFLSGEIEEIQHPGGPFSFPPEKLPSSFIFGLEKVPQRRLVFRDRKEGRKMICNFQDVPYLTVWSDGNPFVCVEPCWGLPDHHEQRPFEQKAGIQIVPAKGQLVHSVEFCPELE